MVVARTCSDSHPWHSQCVPPAPPPHHTPPHTGTLRSNLDPWARFADARLWEVLRMVQLGAAIQGLGGLDARMQACVASPRGLGLALRAACCAVATDS